MAPDPSIGGERHAAGQREEGKDGEEVTIDSGRTRVCVSRLSDEGEGRREERRNEKQRFAPPACSSCAGRISDPVKGPYQQKMLYRPIVNHTLSVLGWIPNAISSTRPLKAADWDLSWVPYR